MEVKQFRYGSDNFSYVIHGGKSALAIDPGAVDDILSYIDGAGLNLAYMTNTHMHPDHTPGNRDIQNRTNASFIDYKTLLQEKAVDIDGTKVHAYHTPGHTEDSFSFQVNNILITGDTLFNGTVGNCFSGDLRAFYDSIKLLVGFPEDSIIYAGHDYVQYAVDAIRDIEPDNPHVDAFLEKYDPGDVKSTLRDEFNLNPYLRFNDPAIIAILDAKNLPTASEYDRWHSLMEHF